MDQLVARMSEHMRCVATSGPTRKFDQLMEPTAALLTQFLVSLPIGVRVPEFHRQ